MGFLDDLHTNFVSAQDQVGTGTLPGLAKMLKGAGNTPPADAGTAKVPLSVLPAGVQPGQRISLTVTGIDAVSGMATIVPDAVQNAVAPAPPAAGGLKQDAVDRAITMGPMDDLKAYLFQKTQEQEQ
jgi:hypothetical protein